MKIDRVKILKHSAALLFFVFVIGVRFYLKRRGQELESVGKINVCNIYKLDRDVRNHQSVCRYYYFVIDEKYYGVEGYYESEYHTEEGEFYEILYHPDNNGRSKILLDRQVPKDSVCSYFDGDCPFK